VGAEVDEASIDASLFRFFETSDGGEEGSGRENEDEDDARGTLTRVQMWPFLGIWHVRHWYVFIFRLPRLGFGRW
jgi:hypothetical protein